tara:strand:- start:337 stop:693 length:357 start_codon:yes stop_codon:yes gene_type:complete
VPTVQFLIYISVFCIGTWGLIVGGLEQFAKEIFLGMIAPLIVGIISILVLSEKNKKNPGNVTNVLIQSFAGKMIFYALYFIYIFTFYTFNPLPFVISFVSYFVTIHICEALFLRSIFN